MGKFEMIPTNELGMGKRAGVRRGWDEVVFVFTFLLFFFFFPISLSLVILHLSAFAYIGHTLLSIRILSSYLVIE